MGVRLLLPLIAILLFGAADAFAQSPSSLGAMIGRVIPSGPDGVTEIFGVGGVRYSTSSETNSQYEMGAIFGSAGPILWHDLFINTRYNMPSHGFTNHIGIGLDVLKYRSAVTQTTEWDSTVVDAAGNPILREKSSTAVGIHILGGLSTELVNPIFARADMKLNLTPALILTINIGLEWRFGSPITTK